MESCDPVGTPMEIKDKLDLDQNGSPVDATKYHSMIGALMYLTSSRPDIGTVNTGLWYMKDSGFELTGFSDADYAGCKDTFKSTSGGAQFLGEKLVSWSSKKQDCTALSTAEAEYGELFGNSGNSQCVLNDFSDTLIDSYQMVLWIFMNRRDLPRNTPLDRLEVLGMIEKRSKVKKGIVPTEMELVLEQPQQGTSHEVSVSTEGVKE
ncbi:hypothetical protein Tco_0006121 [Tanacetum coccineum]